LYYFIVLTTSPYIILT